MTSGPLWIATLLAPSLLALGLALTAISVARLRGVTLALAAFSVVNASLPVVVPELRALSFGGALGSPYPPLLRVDQLSVVLPALSAALWLFTVAVTPRMLLDGAGLRRAALATALTTFAFLTVNPLVLFVPWTLSVFALRAASTSKGRPTGHYAHAYLLTSAALFGVGAVLLTLPSLRGTRLETAGLVVIVLAALIRKGIFPFHAWVPALFEHGRLGPSILFCAPQLGTYAVAVLVVPRAPSELLRVVAIISLATAVYAAAMALVQRSARRACAYLFTSQSALVMAGLDCTSEEALTGALVLWLSSSLAFAGLARCVLVLEARRGPLDLSKHHGGYASKPLLAVSFLLLGLTCTGFPGTLGFVGEELLLGGAVADFPVLGFLVVASGALTGLAVLRMYFSLFCGTKGDAVHLELRPREAVGFGAVVGLLLLMGLAPGPLVHSRHAASAHLLALRRQIGADR